MTSTDSPATPSTQHANTVRLAAYVLVLSVFFAVAREGVPGAVLYTLFALYIVVATLWVRGLDEAWRRDLPESQSLPVWLTISALPLVFAAGSWVLSDRSSATLGLGALLSAYVAIGLAIRHLRWGAAGLVGLPDALGWLDEPKRVGQVIAGCAVALAGGLLVLGRVHWLVPALLVGLPVLVVPTLVHVLSERSIRVLAAGGGPSLRRLVALGLALVAGVGLLAWFVPQSRLPFVVLVVAALLVAALAAGSLGDVAVALAVLALMGVSQASSDLPSVIDRDEGTAMVALGDSYLSGEGASRFIAGTNDGDGNQCRRASTAWPVLVADRIPEVDRLVFRACSGAQAVNVREKSSVAPATKEQYAGEGQQITTALQELRGTKPALVVLSIGGNDAGFSQIGVTCLALGDCDDAKPSGYFTGNNLDRVRNRLRQTYADVTKKFDGTPVVAVPYPDPVAGSTGCPSAPLGDGDVAFITRFLNDLDTMIEEEATAYGIYYAEDLKGALADSHLQLCNAEGNEPGLNFLDLRSVGGVSGQRFNPLNWKHNSLHPNERGHAAMAASFESWLAAQGGLSALRAPAERANSPVAGQPEESPGAPPEDCAAFPADHEDGCRARANAWALQTTGAGLLPLIGAGGLGAFGAWLLAVSGLARRRR
jgi:lysophospholipase L1-like esterase